MCHCGGWLAPTMKLNECMFKVSLNSANNDVTLHALYFESGTWSAALKVKLNSFDEVLLHPRRTLIFLNSPLIEPQTDDDCSMGKSTL